MINLGLLAYRTYYRDDIEPDIAVDVAILDVVVDGQTETLQFTIVDGLFGSAIQTIAASLDFDENDFCAVGSHNVDVASARLPVAFDNLIPVKLQKF